jgi:Flp pilus assembly protein TadB
VNNTGAVNVRSPSRSASVSVAHEAANGEEIVMPYAQQVGTPQQLQLSEAFYVQQSDRDKAAERERAERERSAERERAERADRALQRERLAAERAAERADRAAERELRLAVVLVAATAAVAIAVVWKR